MTVEVLAEVVTGSTTEVGRAGAEGVAVVVVVVSEVGVLVLVGEVVAPGESGQTMPVVQRRPVGQQPPPIFTGQA